MAPARPKWLLQFSPTPQGLARYPLWRDGANTVLIYDKAERIQRVQEAHACLLAGDIAAYRCDRV